MDSTKSNSATLTPPRESQEKMLCGMAGMPAPTQEHQWLERFVGEWESEAEICMEPGKPPMKSKGTERCRMLGGFWMISEGQNEELGFGFRLTLGYDPQQKKYMGTCVDTMASHLWRYEGSVDASGRILTLNAEGPAPGKPDKTAQFRDVTEFTSSDHRLFTSAILSDDGRWTTLVTVNSRKTE